jgi:histidine ammonia-lyase
MENCRSRAFKPTNAVIGFMELYHITPEKLEFETVKDIIRRKSKLKLSEKAKEKIGFCREYLDKKIAIEKKPIYGINTGFGSLYNKSISDSDLETLQQNLVKSHACGMGDEVPKEIVRLMLLLKIQALSYGNSGVQVETVERLIYFFNNDILPVVYEQGSLGASGDLAPLAHLSLPLINLGEVNYEGKRIPTTELYKKHNLEPIQLKSKEGLALLNGTQFMSAYGLWCILKAERISRQSDIIGALSLDAFDGRIEPFNELVHKIRPHKGQLKTAENFRRYLDGSELIKQDKVHIQDPYSFRCIPQVHGASKDAMEYVASVILTEINSVTDNPTIFPDDDLIISAGNFHGQPLALALDFLAIAIAELGSISERRTYKLISGQRGLPPFLVSNAGLNSGFMIPQYAAASIVSQNKQLCTPASVDTIDSSNGQEDHVSMGANAATKVYKVINNVERILAIELFNAAQAIEFRRPQRTSPFLEELIVKYRQKVKNVSEDKVMYPEMNESVKFLEEVEL